MEVNKNYIKDVVKNGKRIDERAFDKYRDVKLETGVIKSAEGSAVVNIGNTSVICGVKLGVATPFPDTPNEGILIVNTELSPVASPKFESGPPSPTSIEMARVIDRGIRESHAIDVEKLAIIPGEKVWMINVDIQILDYDGNMMDAAGLAAIAALLNAELPKYDAEQEKMILEEKTGKLPVLERPIPITINKIGDTLLLDINKEEEDAIDAKVTMTSIENGNLCAMQKQGMGYFTVEELEQAADMAIAKGKDLRSLLK